MYSLLVQQRASHAPEPVPSHFVAGITESAQTTVQRVFTQWTTATADRRQYLPLVSSDRLQIL
jgi:hypothetical protein